MERTRIEEDVLKTKVMVLLLAGCLWANVAGAQMPQGTHVMPKSATTTRTATTTKSTPAAKKVATAAMKQKCEAMAVEHDGMMTRMKMMDETLNRLVVAMNAADATHKVDAMSAVVNELVTQRQAMHGMNSMMQGQMMSHMSEHMKSGTMSSMADCPMTHSMGAGMSSSMGMDK